MILFINKANFLLLQIAQVNRRAAFTHEKSSNPQHGHEWLLFKSIQNSNEENGRSSQFLFVSASISVFQVIWCLEVGTYVSNKGITFVDSPKPLVIKRQTICSVRVAHRWGGNKLPIYCGREALRIAMPQPQILGCAEWRDFTFVLSELADIISEQVCEGAYGSARVRKAMRPFGQSHLQTTSITHLCYPMRRD